MSLINLGAEKIITEISNGFFGRPVTFKLSVNDLKQLSGITLIINNYQLNILEPNGGNLCLYIDLSGPSKLVHYGTANSGIKIISEFPIIKYNLRGGFMSIFRLGHISLALKPLNIKNMLKYISQK